MLGTDQPPALGGGISRNLVVSHWTCVLEGEDKAQGCRIFQGKLAAGRHVHQAEKSILRAKAYWALERMHTPLLASI